MPGTIETRTFTCPDCGSDAWANVNVIYTKSGRRQLLKEFECDNFCDLVREDVKLEVGAD